jgi:hypothetical protein
MSRSAIATFEETIVSLDAVDLDTLDDDALHSLTIATQRLRDRFELAAGRLLARWDTPGVWRRDQSLSAPARLSREINSSLRSCRTRAIHVRERHCQHPAGRDIPADQCDVDHIVPWQDSQRTDQFNGRLECPGNNRLPHLHDHDTQPPPPRDIGINDQLRALIWWRQRHDPPDDQAC